MIINVGNVKIGSDYIPIQTMIKNPINQVDKIIKKIEYLSNSGCDLIRVAVPDANSIKFLKLIVKKSVIPIIADIHFDHKLAIMAVDAGVSKIRINPGNIQDEKKIKEIIECVKTNDIPVRIGINSGSLPKHLIKQYGNDNLKIMIESAREELKFFEKYNFDKIVLSFKSSNVIETIKINQIAKKEFQYPLHIGATEAGDITDGTIKNSIALSYLLLNGIGDTIRVSLTSNEENEIIVAKKILESTGKRKSLLEIISCPTCSRTEINIENIVKDIKDRIKDIKLKKSVKIAVMGCIVNGPGEAMHADFGVACGKGKSIIFKKGKKIKIINNNRILDELLIILKDYYEN
ncbi:MAG: flavodoxin-dependent (E)-4-hydroxy-3-methylbut-2-enyl-diphosphate synthase [Spirochaetes bacterium]|nr:flavodoxin-dependent (E)-4-hydroxy-3-methylbut-2-enyl-diphosphate synthase [Spirochaetota bacterium]